MRTPPVRRTARALVAWLLLVELAHLAVATPAAALPDPGPAPGPGRELPRGEWPLQPRPAVVRRFDPPDSAYGAGHRGVDLLGRPGQRVRAALAGTVSFAGVLAGKGVVSVRHGDLRTTYEPVTATVSVGDTVAAGAPIGVLRVGPSHCRPSHCLHWGLVRDRTYLDPLLLVGGGPVRLLPLAGPARSSAVGPGGPGGPDGSASSTAPAPASRTTALEAAQVAATLARAG